MVLNESKTLENNMFEHDDIEECFVILGRQRERFWHGRLINKTEGEPCSVDFDSKYVMRREEAKGDVIGFVHSHPHFIASPSLRDYRTMEAWCFSFGKPLLCGIKGIDGLRFFLFEDDEDMRELKHFFRVGKRLIGRWTAYTDPVWEVSYDALDEHNERYNDSYVIQAPTAIDAETWVRNELQHENPENLQTVPYKGK